MNDNNVPENKKSNCAANCMDFNWWAMLIIAVLAVPSLGIIIAISTGAHGFFGVAIIMVTCWVSTYLGMHLMKNYELKKKQ